jgi:acetyltransferase-like isoleucine patch superfamily enzyme
MFKNPLEGISKNMRTIAEGKDAVLNFLENETLKRTDEKPGVYQLVRDDANNLVLFIEGFSFIGSGTVSINGNLLTVADGRVINLQKPS